MSRREAAPSTPAERIEAIRKTIPPPAGRRARRNYISKDDFADILGAGRSTVISWTTGKSYPDEGYREKLAELSQGRFEPDDFARPDRETAEQASARVSELERGLKEARERIDALEDQIRALRRARGGDQ